MKGSGFPGLKPINKQQGFSLNQLSKWNQQLDNERLKAFHEQQDIKKQKKIAKQNSTLLNTSIQQVEDQAVEFSRQIEQEKTKNQQLTILVKKAEQQIYAQKLEKYEDVINNKQTDEFEEQMKILKQKQKKLQKILDKLNSSDFQISKKIDSIRQLKKQRGIHSNLFNKLEREYFDVEFYYKQLLIERTLKEKTLDKLICQFNKICKKSNDEVQVKMQNIESDTINLKKGSSIFQSQITKSQQKSISKAPELSFSQQKEANNFSQTLRTKKQMNEQKRTSEQLKKVQYKKKVSRILNDFECKSYQEFIKKGVHQIHQKQEEILLQVDQRYEDICQIKQEIVQLQSQLKVRKSNKKNAQLSNKKNTQHIMKNIQFQMNKQKQQILQFKGLFETVYNNFSEEISKNREDKGQITKNHTLHFSQEIQTLKQSMGLFNQILLKSNIHHLSSTNSSSDKKRIAKNSPSFKKRKSSLLNAQIKIKKTLTQSSQIENYSFYKNSECLNEIFNKYQNESEKPGKTQKYDSVSLLTQQQFYIESKRLLSEANKKKSQGTKESQFAKESQTVKESQFAKK